MGGRARRRILVAVEPVVLEGALAALLSGGDRADVIQFHSAHADDLVAHYDAAIVTDGLGAAVRSDLLITLPDTTGAGGAARVTAGAVSRSVAVGTGAEVIDLLAEQFREEMPAIRPPH